MGKPKIILDKHQHFRHTHGNNGGKPMTPAHIFIHSTAFIRSLITWPMRLAGIILGVPNFKIIYKSGHVEYYFFKSLNVTHDTTDGHLTEMEWHKVGTKTPVHINMWQIESIHQIY